ncbi:hypothetical protein PV04_10807 [Phialophora macrospora]|uniref:Uncharacterized protein n=1 Tax=Phialophora macrospora TaxID=1851006 RepID=A0A0D2F6T4_9EURO|nr:hypothetical protein PV04_10807 [Phialophora macrospora]
MSKKSPMPQNYISITRSSIPGDSDSQDWKVKDGRNDQSEFKSTPAQSRSQQDCTYGYYEVMVGNSHNRTSATVPSDRDHKTQGAKAPRKRTLDGSIKCDQNRRVHDMRLSLLEANQDGQNHNPTLQADVDILRRQIAAVRAASRKSNGSVTHFEWAIASKQGSNGESKRASYTRYPLLEWEEVVLR